MTSPPHLALSKRPWLRRGLLGLVLFEIAYVLAFEWAARSGRLERWINQRPEKIVISFASAHSYVPFRVSVSGFELHGQTPKMRWRVGVDRATGWISPVALFRRTLRVPWVEATGGTFWLRREDENLSELAKSLPDEGRERRLPALAALPPLPVPRPPSSKPKWSFELPHIAVSDFGEVWLDGLRLRGEIDARGGFSMYSGREIEVAPSRIDFEALRATLGDVEIGNTLAGAVDGSIERYPFKEQRGKAMMKFISGEAELRGRLADGELLGLFLRRAHWISFGPSLGELKARLVVDRGQLKTGTRVEFQHPQLAMKIFEFEALGDAKVDFELQPPAADGAEEAADLLVRYEDFAVRSAGESAPQIVGTGLSLVATSSARALSEVLDSTRVKIDLGTARIPSLTAFNSWLPASSGLTLVSGSGALTGSLDADLTADRAQGDFRAKIEDAAVRYRGLDLLGGVAVEIRLPDADLETRTFDLAGTRLDLTDFRVPQAEAAVKTDAAGKTEASGKPDAAVKTEDAAKADSAAGWWAYFTLDDGSLTLPPATAASGRFTVKLRDSVPLVGLFETRKNLPNWVANLLTVEDIQAVGGFAWSPAETTLDKLATEFRGATIQGRIRLGHELRKGLLMVEWHRLALGLRIDEDKKDWKFTGVRKWYEKSDLGGPSAAQPADDPLSEAALAQAELGGAVDFSKVELPSVDFAYEIVPGSPVSGELDGDAEREAAAVIALPSVAAPRALRLVAVDLVGGRAIPIGSVELTPGTEVKSLAIEAGAVTAHLLVPARAGERDPATREETLAWKPRAGKRVEPVVERRRR